MLEQLHVKNYALIDELEINFDSGFNVLSGETGAGKSILIGSLGLLLGQKGDPSIIREGADILEVSGVLRIENQPELVSWLHERDIEPDDEALLLRRTLKSNGRGNCFIQGVLVNRNDLAYLTSQLVDLHGQHEHQSILAVENQRKLLDRFGNCEALDREIGEKFSRLTNLKKKFEELNSREKDRLREMDLLAFAMKEIDDARLSPEEEKTLEQEKNLLNQAEKLFQYLKSFVETSDGVEVSIMQSMGKAMIDLKKIADIDDSLLENYNRYESAYYEIEDVLEAVKSYNDSIDFSPERLEYCESRLSQIHLLQKKYGDTIEDVLSYRDTAEEKQETLKNWESSQDAFNAEIRELEQEILDKAGILSEKRKTAAVLLGKLILDRIIRLGMEKAGFQVVVKSRLTGQGKPSCGSHGWDVIEFLISPNQGEPMKPLKNIASGGEVSRVMLAVKSVLAESDDIKSLIFDEVDAGIGGEVALSVGEHLLELAGHSQVLCITHLASIAVRADNHIKVEKTVTNDRTVTMIKTVKAEARCTEIARMLSGDSLGEASLTHARDLLEKYRPAGY